MNDRREFIKKLTLTGTGLALGPKILKGASNYNAIDDAVITVSDDQSQVGHKKLHDHLTSFSQAGLPLSVSLHDSDNSAGQEDWRLVGYSDNLVPYEPFQTGNLLITNQLMPSDIAEQPYTMLYMRPDSEGSASGVFREVNDEVDRYLNKFTITYMVNGNQESLEFFAPNSVTKKVFGWDPEQPIPWEELYSLTAISNPSELEDAFGNLNDILTNPDNYVQRSRLRNRNTPSPCPDPNPWGAEELLLSALSIDPLQQDELYPTQIAVEMTDFTGKNGSTDKSALNSSLKYGSNEHLKNFIKQYQYSE